ncbi:HD domain-containing protein [Flavobacteriales bacterium]|mgnify:FL=1|nr:HD domain-containing protein [Flavobacteriales bacterium]MDC1370333.1 HD domain-containing protein [Flavobacteriales bacterium]
MKILNDPIYGFITIRYSIILNLIDHPYFQRLNRIKQLGLSYLVYPGAHHTRFHHAIGCMHLMQNALEVLKVKDIEITEDEELGVLIAILLHDIGHGPFSHALEHTLVHGVTHEDISLLLMDKLNKEFDGKLSLAIKIFTNKYKKKFLHQLVSSQLDMDRLDYLKRDSFYSGVSEGVVSSDRIINMLNVYEDELVIEEKGIYSIEKFIVARRLMYWQVYLHKTVLSAENLLVEILKRAIYLARNGGDVHCSPVLKKFLYESYDVSEFEESDILENFTKLDDSDIYSGIKAWCEHSDFTLSSISKSLINRNLPKVLIQREPFEAERIQSLKNQVKESYGITDSEVNHFVISSEIANNAYNALKDKINIKYKNGTIANITEASDNFNIKALTEPVKKYFVCYPKEFRGKW